MTENEEVPRILLIEDNPGDVELLRLAIESANFVCDLTVIEDGGEAIDYVRQQGKFSAAAVPDLVVVDLNLPKNDGLEILEEMRASAAFAKMPVAVMSSSSWVRERPKLEKYGISRYITKPPDLDEFLSIGTVLKEVLREAGLGKASRDAD